MIVVKAIKPSPFKSSIFRDEVMREMTGLHGDILNDFFKTAETWKHKPKFTGGVTMRGTIVAVDVKTDDKIYGYVTEGTPPHIIRPKRARVLRFQSKYRAKTKPRIVGSWAGGPSGPFVFRGEVHHPGTEARKFHETIAKAWKPTFRTRMQAALNRAAKRSGHGK